MSTWRPGSSCPAVAISGETGQRTSRPEMWTSAVRVAEPTVVDGGTTRTRVAIVSGTSTSLARNFLSCSIWPRADSRAVRSFWF